MSGKLSGAQRRKRKAQEVKDAAKSGRLMQDFLKRVGRNESPSTDSEGKERDFRGKHRLISQPSPLFVNSDDDTDIVSCPSSLSNPDRKSEALDLSSEALGNAEKGDAEENSDTEDAGRDEEKD